MRRNTWHLIWKQMFIFCVSSDYLVLDLNFSISADCYKCYEKKKNAAGVRAYSIP